MMRILHRWPGLVLAALLFVTALSGAALSIFPTLDAVQAPQAGGSHFSNPALRAACSIPW